MDETRRFIRYVIPGALFAIETVLFLLLFLPRETVAQLQDLKKDQGFGLAVAALLASGAVGYLLSTLHHWLYWHCPSWWGGIDHRPFLQRLQDSGILTINGNQPRDAMDAWTIVSVLWHERVGKHCPAIQAANPRADSLANLVHSAGAAKAGFWCALITAMALQLYCADCPPFIPTEFQWRTLTGVGVVLLLGYFHHGACRDTRRLAQHIVEQILGDALSDEGGVETSFFVKKSSWV